MSDSKSTPQASVEPNALYEDDAPLEEQAGAPAPLDDDAAATPEQGTGTTAAMARRTSTLPIRQYAIQFGGHRFVIFVEGDICLGTSTGWQKWMTGKSWLSDIRPWLMSADRNDSAGNRTVFAKALADITTPADREDFPV
jgi:hypothetical protein